MFESYDAIVVGTGFSSSFFLQRYLALSGPGTRVLVLERGHRHPHAWRLRHGLSPLLEAAQASFTNQTPWKPWVFSLGFGGSSNCWTGNTPRLLPEDFRLRSLYGVGADWPVSYDELEPYYCDAEEIMAIAGPSDDSPAPRSRPYPQPPHRFSDVDKLFKEAYPDRFFSLPSARPTVAVGIRPVCCAAMVCSLCPINSKFTIENTLSVLYADPRVTLRLGAFVEAVDIAAGTAAGVRYLSEGKSHLARGDLVVLGANGLFNPHILQRSGLRDAELGRGLVEQVAKSVVVHLDGVDNFQGSTFATGHGYMLYAGPHRARRAAALIETSNRPELRMERGKWRQTVRLRVIYEDLRQPENRVTLGPKEDAPAVYFRGYSTYAAAAMDALGDDLTRILAPLPVERVLMDPSLIETEAHILGTTPMGDDPERSIVDRNLVHHRIRNLMVIGGSVFPTTSPANPSLTISALALRAGQHAAGGKQII